ncbi:hypothetical protein [Larkinella rosea]|uniref:Uncharacterized protein n=1 Tax=Larkinella rosea TaxID=2025312 RepID=A0A3P1BFB0_9BACT|nr:hypothetical protein [Larkinella rosea]RRA99766.1 hypothetical protein EHT25_24345 [Larkinella rosea]
MQTIQIQVSDEMVARYGAQALAERLEKLLAWEDLSARAKEISTALQEAGIDYDEMAKEAKKRAWEKYKYTIKDKLPPEAFE